MGWNGMVGVMWSVETVGRNRKNEETRHQMSTPPHMTHCFWRIQSAVCIYAPRAVWIRGINKPHDGAVNQSMAEYCLICVSGSEGDKFCMSLQLTGDGVVRNDMENESIMCQSGSAVELTDACWYTGEEWGITEVIRKYAPVAGMPLSPENVHLGGRYYSVGGRRDGDVHQTLSDCAVDRTLLHRVDQLTLIVGDCLILPR